MAMTIVDSSRPITGGVDTHLDSHVAAALDAHGGVLGVESFPTTPAGFVALHDWLCAFGSVARVGIEGTGAYGAGLSRYLQSWGARVNDTRGRRDRGHLFRGLRDRLARLAASPLAAPVTSPRQRHICRSRSRYDSLRILAHVSLRSSIRHRSQSAPTFSRASSAMRHHCWATIWISMY
jgi:transposase